MPSLTQAGRRFLAELAADEQVQLRRTAGARPWFYLFTGKLWPPARPVNQQMANALRRGEYIAQAEQTGQDLPHAVDRATAPFIWVLTAKARAALAQTTPAPC